MKYIIIYIIASVLAGALSIRRAQRIEEDALNIPTGDSEFYKMESPISILNILFPISIAILLVWKSICSLLNNR